MAPTNPNQVEALEKLKALVLERQNDDDADLMLKLAAELYGEADIDRLEYAAVLRIYADWLENDDVDIIRPRKHLI